MTKPPPNDVATAFAEFEEAAREALLRVRGQIIALAEEHQVGPLTETLKWGQPSYLTQATKAGSTIRLGVQNGRAAVFFNCNTTLVDGFRTDFPDTFDYSGNRALLLDENSDRSALSICLGRALRYHRDKRKGRACV